MPRIYMFRHVVFDELQYPFAQKDCVLSHNSSFNAQSTDGQVVLGQSILTPTAQPLHDHSHLSDGLTGTDGSQSAFTI